MFVIFPFAGFSFKIRDKLEFNLEFSFEMVLFDLSSRGRYPLLGIMFFANL